MTTLSSHLHSWECQSWKKKVSTQPFLDLIYSRLTELSLSAKRIQHLGSTHISKKPGRLASMAWPWLIHLTSYAKARNDTIFLCPFRCAPIIFVTPPSHFASGHTIDQITSRHSPTDRHQEISLRGWINGHCHRGRLSIVALHQK